jgi:exonuclease SbcC
MIQRIILENYMAHGRTVIEPAAGLTVLVGPNNCGKSAVVHALQTLCYNKPADFAVRHGEKEASVTVETDDGHIVTWRRRKGVVSYVIDGREVGRLGLGGVPDDLHQILRMPRIESANEGGAPFFVHFGLQKSPIFLLDDPPARAATFFAASSDAEKLLEMQKRHRDKVRDARRDSDKLSVEAAALDKRLEASLLVAELASRMGEVEEAHRRLLGAQRVLEQRTALLARCDSARRQRDRCSRVAAAASPLAAPPPFGETTGLQQTIQKLHIALAQVRCAKSRSASLTKLVTPPEPRAQRAASLVHLLARENEFRGRLAAAKREAVSAQNAIDALRDQVRRWVEEHPHCPTCGAATNVESVLEFEHQHA